MPILVEKLYEICSSNQIVLLNSLYGVFVGQGSAVGIVTRYGFDGPRIELQWGQDFPQSPRPAVDLYGL